MKKDYIEDLKDELEESPLLKEEMYSIVKEYDRLYDEYMNDGLAPSEVERKLGLPSEIVSDIVRSRKQKASWLDPVIYFSFLFSAILYLLIGYFTDIWHPTWLVFMLAPVVLAVRKT